MSILFLKEKLDSRGDIRSSPGSCGSANDLTHSDQGLLSEGSFIRMLCRERKRSERSRKLFLLMLANVRKLLGHDGGNAVLQRLLRALSSSTRDTDISGWYEHNSLLGVIFTEISGADRGSILKAISDKVRAALLENLDVEQVNATELSYYFFPEAWDDQNPGRPANAELYPDLLCQVESRRSACFIKRMMDVAGSIFALIAFWPLFLSISVAIKLSSKGPVLFRQKRVGQYGFPFTFVKFRSMYSVNDSNIHKEYVKRFISGKDPQQIEGNQNVVYKISEDPRVTRVGRFLRKTSLDEFPQFLNVLKGEMSLVGPRPPIPYELESYDIWHRRRVLEVKPGITGLWQVNGRSKTTFDDMVRLDLEYARTWSFWLDIKILLQTPWAVLSRKGAY